VDFSERLDAIQQRVAAAKAEVQEAATESREQLRMRIDQTQGDLNQAAKKAEQRRGEAAGSKWAQIKADAAAKMEDAKARVDKRTQQMDVKAAGTDADWAESGATDALDFAEWAAHNAELAMLDAIDARAYADELARTASS
jgi:hypothetical protein